MIQLISITMHLYSLGFNCSSFEALEKWFVSTCFALWACETLSAAPSMITSYTHLVSSNLRMDLLSPHFTVFHPRRPCHFSNVVVVQTWCLKTHALWLNRRRCLSPSGLWLICWTSPGLVQLHSPPSATAAMDSDDCFNFSFKHKGWIFGFDQDAWYITRNAWD